MTNVSYVSLSRQIALEKELNIIANNVANANTTGYRRDASIFSEYVQALNGGNPSVSQTRIGGHVIDPSQGGIVKTDSQFDLAIAGRGYFVVETEKGLRLTRSGAFTLNANGEMTTLGGERVTGEGGSTIALPLGATRIAIAADGAITADGSAVGRLDLVDADPTTLVREGNSLFRATEGFEQVSDSQIRQGFLESSNVNPVLEIARLIEVQRAFEMGQQMASDESDRIKQTIETVGDNR